MTQSLLDIVGDNDEVIGQASRSEIHEKSLLHREVHVFFVTKNKEIVFQKRKPSSDGISRLDATVGGHVELGASYLETALKEMQEETGLNVNENDLIFWRKIRAYEDFSSIGKVNNVFRSVYIYRFDGLLDKLKVEENVGNGFILFPMKDFLERAAWIEKGYFVTVFLREKEMTELFEEIANG